MAGNECNAICDIMRATGILMHRIVSILDREEDLNLCGLFSDGRAIYFNDGNDRDALPAFNAWTFSQIVWKIKLVDDFC